MASPTARLIRTTKTRLPVAVEAVQRKIYVIRGRKVMLDGDLAQLYRVTTSSLNRAVKRNLERFPEDFMFQLSLEEAESLRCQIGISKSDPRGGRRYMPYVFTEHGVAMLSAVLKSQRAVQMSILIVRTFVRLREWLASHKTLAGRIERLEAGQRTHSSVISILAGEIKEMKRLPPLRSKKPIGFRIDP